jgi:hypothetical protein
MKSNVNVYLIGVWLKWLTLKKESIHVKGQTEGGLGSKLGSSLPALNLQYKI